MFNHVAVAGTVALLVGVSAPCSAQEDVASLVAQASPAVVSLKPYDVRGRQLGTGSGFVLDDGRIVTNTHVVRGAANVEIFDADGELIGATQFAEALSNSVDLAILPRFGSSRPGLSLAERSPTVGTRILVIGAPQGLSNTVSDGLVSAVREIESRRLIQISAPISPGSSGGPVLDLNGRVVGVTVGMLRAGQNLNFAVPVEGARILAESPAGRIAFTTISADTGGAMGAASRATQNRITPGEAVTGRLGLDDEILRDGSFFQTWQFEGRRHEVVTISMNSSEFDTFLMLGLMANGRYIPLARDDDGGPGTNSRLRYRLPSDGEYVIRANAFRPGETGAYTLRLDRN